MTLFPFFFSGLKHYLVTEGVELCDLAERGPVDLPPEEIPVALSERVDDGRAAAARRPPQRRDDVEHEPGVAQLHAAVPQRGQARVVRLGRQVQRAWEKRERKIRTLAWSTNERFT